MTMAGLPTTAALVLASILGRECAVNSRFLPSTRLRTLRADCRAWPFRHRRACLPSPGLPALSLSGPHCARPRRHLPSRRHPRRPRRSPEAHAAEVCDCHAEVDVPIYAGGQIVWCRREHPTGRGGGVLSEMSVDPQCNGGGECHE
jgi:hypothetical protein